MQFSHALIALVAASLANAQLPDVPKCSLNCFVSALTSDGCSELTDFACHCQKTQLISSVTPCVQKACEVSDQISVSNVVVSQCSAAGHPISVPPIETTTSESSATETGSGSESATPTDSGSASATPTDSGSATPSGSATSTGATTPGATPSGSGPAGSTPAGTSTPLPSKTSGGSGGSGGATTSPAFNGAAGIKGNMAGVAAVAAAAAYIL